MDTNSDQFLALLDFRNTPTQGIGTSPAQRMLSRRTRTLLPMSSNLLRPSQNDSRNVKKQLAEKQTKQAEYFNKHAHDLPPLQEGDIVRISPYKGCNREWEKGTVHRRVDNRSYEVNTPSGTLRRNRRHLRHVRDPQKSTAPTHTRAANTPPARQTEPIISVPELSLPEPEVNRDQNTASETVSTETVDKLPVKTRSGREVKKPARFEDFVKH